jgi:gliding motility-associated-like protein
VTPAGGTAPYDFSIDGGGTYPILNAANHTFTTLTAGTYNLTVRDANNCVTAIIPVTITQPAVALSATTTQVNVSCFGGNDGSITVTPAGGTAPYDFSIDGGGTYPILNAANHTFTTLTAGPYNLTVRDANNCVTAIIPVTITQPAVALSATTTQVNVSCFGGNDGSITVTPAGGTAPYDFSIDGGGTYPILNAANHTFTTLTAGPYNLTVRDANNCVTAIIPVTITQPAVALSATTTQVNVSCFGGNDGSITVTPAGGTAPYDFSIDGGGTYPILNAANHTFTTLTAGPYNLTVRDANNCVTAIIPVTITQPAVALSATTTQVNVSCFGGNDGSITVTPAGGTAPYDFSIDGGGTYPILNAANHTFTTLTAGPYNLTVRDANNCVTAIIPVTITQPAVALSATTTQVNVSCFGGNDGSITVTPAGGTAPYDFSIDGGGTYPILNAANHTFTTLTAGPYNLTVRDANNCVTAIIPVTITQPAVALSATTTQVNVSCFGGNDGSITVTPAGGTAPYDFSIDGGGTYPILNAANHTFTTLTAGPYNLTVRDANNCVTAIIPVTITQPFALNASVTTITNVLCNGGNTGAIDITVGGGTLPYGFLWSNGATTEDVTTLTAGVYSVTITDANGCLGTLNGINVTEPLPIVISSATDIDATCAGVNDGSIQVNSVTGGAAPYQYSNDNGVSFQVSNLFTNLLSGNYDVVARDANGCVSPAVVVTVGSGLAFTPTANATDATCSGVNDGSITVTAEGGGTGPYTYSSDNGATFGVNPMTGLAPGTYDVVVRDANGCLSNAVSVTINSGLVFTPTATATDATCSGLNDGIITVTAEGGGTGPYTYSSDSGVTFGANPMTGLAPGTFDVVVRDNNGCLSNAISVTVNSGLVFTPTAVPTDASCSGINDGSINVTAEGGGVGPYTYSSDNGATFGVNPMTGLAAGTYDVVVRDNNGCLSNAVSVTVGSGVVFTPTVSTTAATCTGINDGVITITAENGGVGPYTYSSDNGVTFGANPITGLAPGSYDVVVQDSNGCLSTAVNVSVAAGTTITFVASKTDASCLANDGSITVSSVIGGTGPYSFSINNGATFQLSNLFNPISSGNYNVVVRDANGCLSASTPVTILIPGGCGGLNCFAFTVTSVEQRPSCTVQDDGQITFTVSGGTPNYIVTLTDSVGFSVSLPGAGPNFAFTNLSAADYFYIIQDQAGNICPLPYSLPVQTNVDADASGLVDASCFGQPTGQATLTVNSGGNSPYEYSLDGITWVSFTSPHTITDLPPNGAYSILVRDDASDACPDQVPVTINAINPQIDQPFTVTPATCNNNDGVITLTSPASGGAGGPYTFLIDGIPTAPVANEFTGLSGGNRTLSVIDNVGCQRDFIVPIIFPGFVNTSLPTISGPDCISNGTNGVIAFTILDVGSFEFAISTDPLFVPADPDYSATGGPNVIIPNLTNGDYFVWVRSLASQCPTKLGPLTVIGVYGVSFLGAAENELCFGDGGSIVLSNIVGAPNIDYGLEINGTITSSIDFITSLNGFTEAGLAPGSYQVRLIQDQTALNGCTVSTAFQPFTIDGPNAALGITSATPTLSFPDQPTGSMQVVIQESGEEDYEVWLTSDEFNSDTLLAIRNPILFEAGFTNLAATDYVLHVKDALGCEVTQNVSIAIDPTVFVPNIFTPNNDGVNDEFYVRNLPTSGSKLIITNRWGTEVYSSGNYNPDNLWNGGDSPDGIYYYRLQIQGGKTYSGWVEIVRGVKP